MLTIDRPSEKPRMQDHVTLLDKNTLDGGSASNGTSPAQAPHPFYVFTTVGLALFLLGVAFLPVGAPRFQSRSAITIRLAQHATTVDALQNQLGAIAREVEREDVGRSPVADGPLLWRVEAHPSGHELEWQLRISGQSPADVNERLRQLTQRALVRLEVPVADPPVDAWEEMRLDAPVTSMGVPPLVAWISRESKAQVVAGRAVTPTQVVLLGTLAVLAAAGFTVWCPTGERRPPLPVPPQVAEELDLPVLGILGREPPLEWRPSPSDASRHAWPRWGLRLGEASIAIALAVTAVQTVRSEAIRELFFADPLTTFRAVVRPHYPTSFLPTATQQRIISPPVMLPSQAWQQPVPMGTNAESRDTTGAGDSEHEIASVPLGKKI